MVAGIDFEQRAVQKAADRLNGAMASLLGLKVFLVRQGGGNPEFMRQAEKLSSLATPQVGATRQEIEQAAARWYERFEELVNG
jgi:hypothetical protein